MLEYNDTVVYRYEVVAENREYLLQGEKYLPDDTIRNITGFVRLQDTTGLFRRIRLLNIFLGNPDDSLQQADRFKQIPPVHPREIKGLDPD